MKTSDKELDDIFKAKLNGLEAEPSANLWQNIAAGLDGKPKKKNFVPVLRVAAGVLVLLSVGLFWLRPNERPVKKQLPQKVAKLKVKAAEKEILQPKNHVQQKTMLLLSAKNMGIKEASAKPTTKLAALKPKAKLQQKPDEPDKQTLVESNPPAPQLAVLPQHIAVVPDESVALKIQPKTDEELLKQVPFLAAKIKPEPAAAKRKSIRHVGDLVNLVMAKVDKRQNKLIEFSTDDDGDESNVTGINLGIISLKKEK